MEFDMTLAVPRGRPDIKAAVEKAVAQRRERYDEFFSTLVYRWSNATNVPFPGICLRMVLTSRENLEVQTAAETKRTTATRMADLREMAGRRAPNPTMS